MVTHFSLDNTELSNIDSLIHSDEFQSHLVRSSSVLIQLYSASTKANQILSTIRFIKSKLPNAIIVGATTVGEICDGKLETGKQVIGFSLFQSSLLTVVHQQVNTGQEFDEGKQLGQTIKSQSSNTKGVLLLSTPLSVDAANLLRGMESTAPNYQLFGGGAGDYASMNNSLVFFGNHLYDQGVIAVVMSGDDLQIDARTYLGWRSLSRPMTVTSVNGLIVETIDGKPAFDVYKKYLDLNHDDDFFLNALEFPFLLQRHGTHLARVPVGISENNGLIFVADIEEGETLKLGYGDPELIIEGAKQTLDKIEQFCPDTVFLYSCGCRRFLMQEDVELETLPIQNLAPTFGFYTYGEFFSQQGKLPLLNSTLVAVSIREGAKKVPPQNKPEYNKEEEQDPYAHKHSRIVSRLVQFITATTRELEQANLAKSRFLANTSHELRTPLTSISGYAEAILNGDIEEQDQRQAVEIIYQQSKHLNLLINDLLDISKIEAEKLTISPSDFDLLALLQSIEASFHQLAEQKGVKFNVAICSDVPLWIHTDEERLNQILVNLCANALKFTKQGAVELSVTLDSETQMLQFNVKDSGVGLTKSQINSIFQPFQQVQQANSMTKGTGLGLSISQHLASVLGGEITATSVIGLGSCFSLALPVQEAATSNKVNKPAPVELPNNNRKGKILIAEDSKENGELFKLLLANAGYQVSLVENGQQAVELTMQSNFDLLFLDIQMPVMDGLQAVEILAHSSVDCPIVALTANAMPEELALYKQKGFTACLSKPIEKTALIECASQYTGSNNTSVDVEIGRASCRERVCMFV